MPYIASTMPSDVNYTLYNSSKEMGSNIPLKRVLIKGQAGVAQKSRDGRLWTPQGTMNKVTEEELELLQKDGTFQKHLKSGGVKIVQSNTPIEKVAKDMSTDKKSAPLTDADRKPGGRLDIPDEMKPNGGKPLQ